MTSQFKRLLGLTAAIVLGATAFAGTADAAKLRMAWAQDATGLDPHKQLSLIHI